MEKVTKINDAGVQLIKFFEQLRLKPYLDAVGIPTIGWGTIRYPNGQKVKMTDPPITEEFAEACFRHDLNHFELAVDALCRDDINENQFAALTSFAYNVGESGLRRSSLLAMLNKNPKNPSISKEFNKWIYGNGKKLGGLITRRQREAELYFTPVSENPV